jgi:hypothetical protein
MYCKQTYRGRMRIGNFQPNPVIRRKTLYV